jgi:hypothetical protein
MQASNPVTAHRANNSIPAGAHVLVRHVPSRSRAGRLAGLPATHSDRNGPSGSPADLGVTEDVGFVFRSPARGTQVPFYQDVATTGQLGSFRDFLRFRPHVLCRVRLTESRKPDDRHGSADRRDTRHQRFVVLPRLRLPSIVLEDAGRPCDDPAMKSPRGIGFDFRPPARQYLLKS